MKHNGKFRFMLRMLVCVLLCMLMLHPTLASLEVDQQAEEMGPVQVPLLPEAATELGIPVETQYATFYFPAEYAGRLQFTRIESEEGTMMFATAVVADREVELYFIAIGMIEMDGVCLGKLQDETAGELSIYLQLVELDVEGFSQEDASRLYELQESVNVLLEQLMEDPRYVAE